MSIKETEALFKPGLMVYRKVLARAGNCAFDFIGQSLEDAEQRLAAIKENGRIVDMDAHVEEIEYEGELYYSYVVGYTFDENNWYFELRATSLQNAEELLHKIRVSGKIDGCLGGSISMENMQGSQDFLDDSQTYLDLLNGR